MDLPKARTSEDPSGQPWTTMRSMERKVHGNSPKDETLLLSRTSQFINRQTQRRKPTLGAAC